MNEAVPPVVLQCVKDRNRLRVRVVSPGYYPLANCQFPRNHREEGRLYEVPRNAIQLITSRSQYYYSVRRSEVKILESLSESLGHVSEDETTDECVICMAQPKSRVFVPCGHFYTCYECARELETCPICRWPILGSIDKSQLM
jgi:uncharacterized CHY-type Zn-finger protein